MIDCINVGDVLSENSHYKVTEVSASAITCIHKESGGIIKLGENYIKNYCSSADDFSGVVEVTKEDKFDGTPGIRTIFENIHTSEVFTVIFKKQDKKKTAKQIKEEKENQIQQATQLIEKAKTQKKSMAAAYSEALAFIQNNPIQETIEGEKRTLRGYKIQFQSRDGRYDCRDLDIDVTEKESGIRPVNILTIESLIYKGVKYVVK